MRRDVDVLAARAVRQALKAEQRRVADERRTKGKIEKGWKALKRRVRKRRREEEKTLVWTPEPTTPLFAWRRV